MGAMVTDYMCSVDSVWYITWPSSVALVCLELAGVSNYSGGFPLPGFGSLYRVVDFYHSSKQTRLVSYNVRRMHIWSPRSDSLQTTSLTLPTLFEKDIIKIVTGVQNFLLVKSWGCTINVGGVCWYGLPETVIGNCRIYSVQVLLDSLPCLNSYFFLSHKEI